MPSIKYFSDFVQNVPYILASERAQYSRLQPIGSGSYGKCFIVVNQKTKERLACKILSCSLVKEEENKELVKNEIKFHVRMKHENIVRFVESFADRDHIYIVLSLCSNGSLQQMIAQRKVIDVSECRYCVYQILKGANYIHTKSIIHRDLKLANILIDANMQMKICDFGLAISECDALLEAGIVCGTTNYLAPEVIDRKGFKRQSDVWAIGVIAFVLVHGYKPFEDEDEQATYKRISRADYRLPANTEADLKSFFRKLFEVEFEVRPNAIDCLKLDFFQMHVIPRTLPTLTLPDESSAMNISLSGNVNDAPYVPAIHRPNIQRVDYPTICVQKKPELSNSMENDELINVLQILFHRFNRICASHKIESDANIDNLVHLTDLEPNYWVSRWSYDDKAVNAFAYQLSDGSIGMLFLDGAHFIRTPDNMNWSVSSKGKLQRVGDPRGCVQTYLMKFEELEHRLVRNGHYDIAAKHNRSKLPHLITWFHTDGAMVMCLSNHTIQINFSDTHKKVVICPHNQSITFVTNKICPSNFKTIKFDTVAAQGLSEHHFSMFKYAAATIEHLMTLLKNEN